MTTEQDDLDSGKEISLIQPRKKAWFSSDFRNVLYVAGYDDKNRLVSRMQRSANDPQRDVSMITAFLELEEAYRMRSVEIVGHQIGALWVTSNPPQPEGFIDREFTTIAGMQRMLNYVISRCVAGGFVATVDLVPEKNTHRMGGYTMVGKVRKNRALTQREQDEPCRIVYSPNYDDRLFDEMFVGGVQSRFQADTWIINNKPLLASDNGFYKVVPEGYLLNSNAE